MVNRPSVPEIITVNSEELQTLIRDLLPSQNGFGSELQATNIITPIIDLTAAAEGSALSNDLSRALAYGSQSSFSISNSSPTMANSPGFYRVIGTASQNDSGGGQSCNFQLTDGATPKVIWGMSGPGKNANVVCVPFDFVIWLAPGISLLGVSDSAQSFLVGSIRQVADSLGQTVQPSGYPL